MVAFFGGSADDYLPTVEIWPDFSEAFRLFCSLETQWRTTSGGPTGLDYNVIPMMAGLLKIEVTPQLMDDLQLMEAAALAEIYKSRGNQE